MKKTAYAILLAGACFAGVFGALQLNRYMESRHSTPTLGSGVSFKNPTPLTPANYDPSQLPEPVDFRSAAKKVIPSVVSVDRFDQVSIDPFSDSTRLAETGTGSGVILSADGIIVTNNHVVAEGQPAQEVQVRLADKRSFKAKVLGRDPRSDLAVLKIEAGNLTPIEVADNNQLQVGEWVLAVGNPLGYDNTVSAGVVSSLGRKLSADPTGQSVLVNAIQTDAAINPGNSGGALTNAEGQLVGINSAIASTSGGSIGIGFAIPVDLVKRVVQDIVKTGHVQYGYFGVGRSTRSVDLLGMPQARQELKQLTGAEPPESGMLILRGALDPNGAASAAGIKELDVITQMDDTKIQNDLDFLSVLSTKRPGDKVRVTYWEKGKIKTTDVTLRAETNA